MANYANLKATINANIKANGAEEITGPILNNVLNAAVNALGAGWQYMGVATPATSPGTPDANVFYIASTAGTYTNFGGLAVADGEVAILKYNGSWSKEVTGAATAAQVTQLGQEVGTNKDNITNLQQEIDSIQPIIIEGNVTNAPDEEDITTDSNDLLKFADRPTAVNQMGYVILRKNKTFAEQVTKENTIYEIRYPFDLGGASVTVPTWCVLKFNGGILRNGTLSCNNSRIMWEGKVFDGVSLSGTVISALNPLMWGISDDGVENYRSVYNAFVSANATKANLKWDGVSSLKLEIPDDAPSIPLTGRDDFGGVKITVTNKISRKVLFRLEKPLTAITVSSSLLTPDNRDFSSVLGLSTGRKILVVKDANVWTVRNGNTNFFRYDTLLLDKGQAFSSVISTYNNSYSSPECYYIDASLGTNYIKNLSIVRDDSSTYETLLFSIVGVSDIVFSGISVHTDNPNSISSDRVAHFGYCTNLRIEDYNVFGLYDNSGSAYGLQITACSNIKITGFNARVDNWGVIGSNCVQNLLLDSSNINRLDVHCYGKNIQAIDCSFKDLYNAFEGCYGRLVFENCKYNNSIPIQYGNGSFNAWTPVDIFFNKCDFSLDRTSKNYLIDMALSTQVVDNTRPELATKCLPNITFEKCSINLIGAENVLYVFNNMVEQSSPMSYIDNITFRDVKINKVLSLYLNKNGTVSLSQDLRVLFERTRIMPENYAPVAESGSTGVKYGVFFHYFHSVNSGKMDILDSELGIYMDNFLYYEIRAIHSKLTALYRKSGDRPSEFYGCDIYMTDAVNANYYELPYDSRFYDCIFTLINENKRIQQTYNGSITFANCKKTNNSIAYLDGGIANNSELNDTRICIQEAGANLGTRYMYEKFGLSGRTAKRPALNANFFCRYYDIDLKKEILWNGTAWVNLDGSALS